MVSKSPNPESGFYMDPTGVPLPGITQTGSASSGDQDPKKIRKPYTITKSRESWTEPEHDKFLEALQLFDRDWKKIEAFVGSKTVIQIRSHAQKYFLKAQKSGKGEHLPPPRPKRKAAHPYPQKATKNVSAQPQTVSFQSSAAVLEPGYILSPNSLPIHRVPITSASTHSQANDTVPKVKLSHPLKGPGVGNNCCSSTESTPMARAAEERPDQGVIGQPLRVLPDFTRVYSFIGSVFDPNSSCHLQKLKKMDRIDVETVLLLMKNLSINLCSPDFEDHRKLLSSYELGSEMTGHDDAI